jgi:hypothetical protein
VHSFAANHVHGSLPRTMCTADVLAQSPMNTRADLLSARHRSSITRNRRPGPMGRRTRCRRRRPARRSPTRWERGGGEYGGGRYRQSVPEQLPGAIRTLAGAVDLVVLVVPSQPDDPRPLQTVPARAPCPQVERLEAGHGGRCSLADGGSPVESGGRRARHASVLVLRGLPKCRHPASAHQPREVADNPVPG